MNLKDLNIDKSWTLFLDRDGVINKCLENDYVKCWEEFEFLPGVIESVVELNKHFGKIIVVTNQQGIGKGLYTESDLEGIHMNMMLEIILAGGQIDRVFYAPQLAETKSEMRKPNIGMARLAKEEFPAIDFSRSIIAGDSLSDMQFGRAAGMKTVLLGKNVPSEPQQNLVDLQFASLAEFAKNL